jgi:hypothetical protein
MEKPVGFFLLLRGINFMLDLNLRLYIKEAKKNRCLPRAKALFHNIK